MDKFEYKEITIDEKDYIDKLNNYGQSGWELIHVEKHKLEICNRTYVDCVLKRKITDK